MSYLNPRTCTLTPIDLLDWVDALRSDEHVQGRKTWRNAKGCQCCLNVLMADVLGWDARLADHPYTMLDTWESLGQVVGADNITRFVDLNDEFKASFDEIADLIEAELLTCE